MYQHYLVIDIGNTNQKVAVFNSDAHLVELRQHPTLTQEVLQDMLTSFNISQVIVSSVGSENREVFQWLSQQVETLFFHPALKLPIDIRYATPQTLGSDRIANAVAANELFPNTNVLSLQLGSCLVADFVNADNQYLGGSIAPGLRMRFKALSEHTAHLPLVEPTNIDFLIGKSTEESILSGVMNGYAGEIDALIQQYKTQYSDLKIVITGGDTNRIEGMLKNSIFAAPNLVLYGLYKILRLNATEI